MVLLPLVITLLLTLTHTAVAHAERWQPPLARTTVARGFDFDAGVPFAAGARRGVRLTGDPGEAVRAPCSGRVAFAGRLPRLGGGVSLRCGGLAATEFGLEQLRVRRGAVVIAGAPVGTLGPRGSLYLGARVASRRWGYRDPLALLDAPAERPLGPAPAPRARRPRVAGSPPPDLLPVTPPLISPLALAAWLGAALAGIGAGLGTTLHVRARRGRAALAPGRPESTHQSTH